MSIMYKIGEGYYGIKTDDTPVDRQAMETESKRLRNIVEERLAQIRSLRMQEIKEIGSSPILAP